MITDNRPKVLVIGVDPSTLDPAAWGVTPEQNAMVQVAIAESERDLIAAGYNAFMCLIALDADLEEVLVPHIRRAAWDVVIIGGGIRKPPELLDLFEKVTNLVHRHAPQAAIAFNTTPTDCVDAARRWSVPQGSV